MGISYPSDTIMANADSPDPTKDLLPVANKEDEVDPVAPAGDPKLPTRKDASFERLPLQDGRLCANYPRCCNKLLSDKSRSSSTTPDRPPPCPPPCTCNPEVHRRYCCGCLSIFPYPIIQLFERQQSHG